MTPSDNVKQNRMLRVTGSLTWITYLIIAKIKERIDRKTKTIQKNESAGRQHIHPREVSTRRTTSNN